MSGPEDGTSGAGVDLVALRRSEETFRLLVAQVVDYAIIGLDPSGVIRTWNAGAQRLKGYPADEAVGRAFSMFYPEDDRRAELPSRLLAQARDEGRVEHTGWRVRRDGSLFWGDVVITALRDDSGGPAGYAKVTRDLTEQHRLDQARTSLFAAVSHDLRSPIIAIGACASLLAGADADGSAELAREIVDNAERLEHLVNGLFDYAKLPAAPPASCPPRWRSAGSSATRCAANSTCWPTGTSTWSSTSPPNAPPTAPCSCWPTAARRRGSWTTCWGTRSPLPDGSPITVRVGLDADRVLLQVTDRGRGIAAEDLPAIFDEFVRGRLATDDGGTGLGLAIVWHLMNGHVRIDSELGTGTTVTLDFVAVD